MSISLFFPPTTYVPDISLRSPLTLRQLCERAGVVCKASGRWAERPIELAFGPKVKIVAEAGDWGKIRIELPKGSTTSRARQALAVLAYGVHDLVAKQSIQGAVWLRIGPPRGRPRTGRALSNAERQRRFRLRRGVTFSTKLDRL